MENNRQNSILLRCVVRILGNLKCASDRARASEKSCIPGTVAAVSGNNKWPTSRNVSKMPFEICSLTFWIRKVSVQHSWEMLHFYALWIWVFLRAGVLGLPCTFHHFHLSDSLGAASLLLFFLGPKQCDHAIELTTAMSCHWYFCHPPNGDFSFAFPHSPIRCQLQAISSCFHSISFRIDFRIHCNTDASRIDASSLAS